MSLGDAHGAYLGCDVGADLAGEYQTHDAGRKLEQHDFTRHIARNPMGHPRALDVEFDLDANDGTDEEGDEQYDADGVDTELGHFLDVLLEEHTHPLGTGKCAPHEDKVTPESMKKFGYQHNE